MNPESYSDSVFILWVMQFFFGVTPWLVLAAGITCMALAFQKFDEIAKRLQKEKVEVGIRGLPKIYLNQATLQVMISALRILSEFSILLSSVSFLLVLHLIRDTVYTEYDKLPDDYTALEVEPSLDFIIICGFIGIATTISIAVIIYNALRRKGQRLLHKIREPQTKPSLVVRLYGHRTFAGIIVVAIGCYPLWAFVMNFIWGFIIIVPLPQILLTVEIPDNDILMFAMFAVVWVGAIFAIYSPIFVLVWRKLFISYRQYNESRILHALLISLFAVMLGAFGGLFTMGLHRAIGEILYKGVF
jgi:hypothetical protein